MGEEMGEGGRSPSPGIPEESSLNFLLRGKTDKACMKVSEQQIVPAQD